MAEPLADDAVVMSLGPPAGQLTFECGGAAFEKLLKFAIAMAKTDLQQPEGDIRVLVLGRHRPADPNAEASRSWKDQIALWGCAITICVLGTPFAIGLAQIWKWIAG